MCGYWPRRSDTTNGLVQHVARVSSMKCLHQGIDEATSGRPYSD